MTLPLYTGMGTGSFIQDENNILTRHMAKHFPFFPEGPDGTFGEIDVRRCPIVAQKKEALENAASETESSSSERSS